ncbi:MAG TPA: peptidoglycan-binding domain-containing protein [Nevskiaceae bacterium]
MSRALVRRLQRALRAKGFSPGGVDGRMGPRTLRALNLYEQAKALASSEPGVLPYATLESLGVPRP